MTLKYLTGKLIGYNVFLDLRIDSLHIVWQLFKIVNAVFMLVILLKQQLLKYVQNLPLQPIFRTVYNFLEGEDENGNLMHEIGYAMGFSFVILLMCLVMYIKLDVDLINSQRQSKIIILLVYYPIVVILLVEGLYSFIVCYLLRCLEDMASIPKQAIVGNILGLILLALVEIYNHNNRIYSFLLFALVVSIKIMDHIPVSIVLIIASLALLYKEKDIVSKCIYSSFVAIAIYKLTEHFQSEGDLHVQSLIYLGVPVLLAITIILAVNFTRIQHSSDLNDNKYLINCTRQLEQSPPQNLSCAELLTIQQIMMNWMAKQKEELPEEVKIKLITTQIKNMKYQSFLELIDAKLKHNADKNSSQFEYVKQFIVFRVVNLYKIYETIELIGHYMQRKSSTYREQYIRKNLQFIIVEQFLSKQSDNEKINQMIKLSRIQEKFIEKSMETFSSIFSFWEKIQMNVLIEEIIEDNFHTIVGNFQKLKQILEELKMGYISSWESRVVGILTKLIQPYSITKQQLEYASRNHNLKQDSNRIITQVSPSFLKIVNSTHSEIINEDISRIMPQEIVTAIKSKQEEAIKSSKVSLVIPIVCGDDLIKIYEANIKLQPQSRQGVEYFYFFKKFQNEQKLAFIYLNTVDLRIKFVSEEFYEKFQLEKDYAKIKIQKQDLYLNNILTNNDPNTIIEELTNKKSLRCDFSTKALVKKRKGLQKPTKFGGFMNLYSVFGNDILISLNITEHDSVSCKESFKNCASEEKSAFESNLDEYKQQTLKAHNFKMISFMDSDNKQTKFQEDENEQYSENAKFCKINNPYKQKIQQKQTQVSTQTKTNVFTFTTCAIAFSVLLVLIMVSMSSILIIFSNQREQISVIVLQNIRKSTENVQLLLHGTFEVFAQQIISQNYDKFDEFITKFLKQNQTVQTILKFQQVHIHQILYQFHRSFTTFFQREYLNQPYQLIFKNFNLNANFNSSNFIDYSYNIKLASQQIRVQLQTSQQLNIEFQLAQQTSIHPLTFLAKNYPTISQIQAPFKQYQKLLGDFQWNSNLLLILISTLAGVYVVIAFSICFVIKSNLETIRGIFYIFSVTQKIQIDRRIQQAAIGSKAYISQVPKDSLKKVADLNATKQKTMVLYQSKVRHSMKVLKKQYEQVKQDEQLKSKIIVSNKKNCYLAAISFIKGVLILTCFFFLILGLFLYKIQGQISQDRIMFRYKNQIEWLKYKQIKQSCDMIHSALIKQVLNEAGAIQKQLQQKQSAVYKFQSGDHSQSFESFFVDTAMLLKQNLCSVVRQHVQILDSFTQCQNIGLGIFQKGFIQVSEYFDFLTLKMKKGELGLLDINEHEVYPNLLIHIKTRSTILNQLEKMSEALEKNRVIKQSKASNIGLILSSTIFIATSITIGYFILFFVPNLFKIRNVGIGYFKLFSKDTLGRMDISSYINENKLLNKISLL